MQHYYTAIVTSTGIICTTVVCPSKDVLKGGCNRERVKQGVKHLFARRSADQQREHIVRFPCSLSTINIPHRAAENQPNTEYRIPNTKYKVPGTEYQASKTKLHIKSSTEHEVQNTKCAEYQIPNTKYQVPNTNWTPNTVCQISNAKHPIPTTKHRILHQTHTTDSISQ